MQSLSSLGDAFSLVAVPLLVLHKTGSVVQMGAVTGVTGLAALVSGVFAGAVADRFDRRRLLRVCDLGRFVLLGLVPLFPSVGLLYVVLPAAGLLGMLFDVTYTTVVPQLVREDQITAANARLYGSYAAAFLVGPALAGLVSGRFGPSVAVGVDALSFLLSAIGVSFVRLRDPTSGPETSPTHDGFLAGVRYLWGQPVLRALTVLLTLMTPIIVGLNDVVVYRLKHDLRQPDAIVGMVLSAGIVGTLLASASVTALRRRWGFGPTWIATSALCGVTIAGIGLVAGVPEIAALSAAGTLCTGIGGICSMSLRQEITPGPLLGRVTAAFWTIHSALGPLGAAGLTLAASRAGVPGTLVVAGAACTVIALAALVTPVRRR